MTHPGSVSEQRAVVLLSGGLDSTTCLALARAEGRVCHVLSVAYGQRHRVELEAAREIAREFDVREHRVITVDLAGFGGSALTNDSALPKAREPGAAGIPVTYVPARNTVFLALGLAWAEALEAAEIWIGVNALDYSGYPDCRPEFLEAFQRLAQVATKVGVEGRGAPRIRAPLLELSKPEIIRLGLDHGVDFSLTSSCYDPDSEGRACRLCEACRLRSEGFRKAEVPDPTRYAPG